MNTKTLTRTALIAAVYTVVSLTLAPISFSNIQVRIAEALTMLPLIYQPSIVGVTLGCFLTNLLGAMMGVNPTGYIDCVVGTIATLLAALITYRYRNSKISGVPVVSILAPVVLNMIFVGAELAYLFAPESFMTSFVIFGLEVAVGELIAVLIGWLIVETLKGRKIFD